MKEICLEEVDEFVKKCVATEDGMLAFVSCVAANCFLNNMLEDAIIGLAIANKDFRNKE